MAAAAAIAVLFGISEAPPAFLVSAAAAIFAGGLIWVATRRHIQRSTIADVSAFVFLAWLFTPLFAIPAIGQLAPDLDFTGQMFESYSAFTTTGAVLMDSAAAGPALVLWRCTLGFLGGFATLLFAAGLLAAFDQSGPRMQKSVLLTHDPDNVFSNFALAARRVFALYSAFTFLCFVILTLSGTEAFDALCLALSSMSTSGYSPRPGALDAYVPDFGLIVVTLACLAGALNIAYLRNLFSRNERKYDPDLGGMAILIVAVFALFMIASGFEGSVVASLAESVFAVTTSGFHASDNTGFSPLAAIFAALVGGAAASTAGGLKISRLVLLWNQTFAELARLADPSSVISLQFRGGDTGNAALVALWSTILAFIATMAIGMLALAVLGAPLDHAWTAAAAALSNTGPLYQRFGLNFLWADFGLYSRIVLMTLMVLGRLEVLAGAAAIIALVRRH
ncbi:potassium transporter TrkG [Hyphobacterium marinum]|uniref:Potassium transporter TrkG n=1 Tax=Hyphobacterium marinum TaxID=3116574 RepID=A0ABU7LYH0_9PROT|nr:potassium transporter TrkG [Hyphobacterium sp. Y6023]MEE2566589.1 potassium transporter TrkG [Hyphobacterium sp. Y6023]